MNLDRTIRRGPRGKVFLVGAGPGDPELLTRKAYRLLTSAKIVAYDELVSASILALALPDAELLAVGRRKGSCPQAPAIHPEVLARALGGRDVVRLKGGDPMIFGRGGEEAEQLSALHVPFEVVPGISAALGAAASACIPLTHRDAASSVTFRTAHRRFDKPNSNTPPTLVFYMGLATLRETALALVEEGRAPTTPVAVISHATLPTERVAIADLATIADAAAGLEAPALVIVGEVVARAVASSSAHPYADLVFEEKIA